MRTLRRFLVVVALMFWQGGFLFYAAVVVRVGTGVLGSGLRQGFITREVTRELNLAAAVALVVLGWEVLAGRDLSRTRRWSKFSLWLFMAACQGGLFWLHGWLDALLQRKGLIVLDPERFHVGHRVYLWLHTIQWAAALVFLLLVLIGWRCEDRSEAERGKLSA
jgi:hypothetical protein